MKNINEKIYIKKSIYNHDASVINTTLNVIKLN
jgi:hypothetical protein